MIFSRPFFTKKVGEPGCSTLCKVASLIAFCLIGSGPAGLSDVASAQEDARLVKRIENLENENLALRKVIGELQAVLENVPRAKPTTAKSSKLRIVVLPGDWGESQLEDMRRVCLSAAQEIWKEIPDDGLTPIHISRSNSGPISLYQRGKGYEYQVRLDTGNRAWAQCAYQFAHEFCHILCNYRNVPNKQLWFEETLCELASLYSLRKMGEAWKTRPPYSNWKSYAKALTSYADQRIQKYENRTESVAQFFATNKNKLFSQGTLRELNGFIAVKLLPLFEKNPSGWQAIRYINLGPKEENESFEKYLAGWHRRVPENQKAFVKRIAREFGVELK